MKKYCPNCKKTKSINYFYSYGYYCKQCYNKRSKKWREENKSKVKNNYQRYYNRCKIILVKLKCNGCSICGYDKCIRSLHFHHVNSKHKKFPLTIKYIAKKRNELIVDELNKCILLCCNCHMEIEEK